MITLTRKQQIIMRHLAGESNRQIASALHISKDTVNKYVKEYDAQRAELLAKDPGADPSEVLHAFVEQPKYNTQNRMPVKVTPEMRAAVAECLRLNEEKRASGRRKQEMRKTDIDDALNLRRQISVYLPPTDIFQPLRQLSQESFEILITEDALLHLPDQLLHEDDSLLCALDRIFDDATVFNIRGESYRGKSWKPLHCRPARHLFSRAQSSRRANNPFHSEPLVIFARLLLWRFLPDPKLVIFARRYLAFFTRPEQNSFTKHIKCDFTQMVSRSN